MKKLALMSVLMLSAVALFAQADLQPLVTVKLNKSETITLKQLNKSHYPPLFPILSVPILSSTKYHLTRFD